MLGALAKVGWAHSAMEPRAAAAPPVPTAAAVAASRNLMECILVRQQGSGPYRLLPWDIKQHIVRLLPVQDQTRLIQADRDTYHLSKTVPEFTAEKRRASFLLDLLYECQRANCAACAARYHAWAYAPAQNDPC